jgi:3-phenylpropionate/trans-cinnamate dioxygenase ferredoxin subunit
VDYIRVGGVAEIPDGEMRAFDTPGGRVTVAHVDHLLFGFGDECTHAGCSLADGEFDDREARVECPCHGSVFDVETGEPVGGPAVDPVPIYATRMTQDGWVEVATMATRAGDDG